MELESKVVEETDHAFALVVYCLANTCYVVEVCLD